MKYQIKVPHFFDELAEIFTDNDFDIEKIEENEMETNIKDSVEYEKFLIVLSIYIICIGYKNLIGPILIKNGMSEEVAEGIVEKTTERVKASSYFSVITNLLLREYFKTMNKINIESFIRFNMLGFQEEVEQIALSWCV